MEATGKRPGPAPHRVDSVVVFRFFNFLNHSFFEEKERQGPTVKRDKGNRGTRSCCEYGRSSLKAETKALRSLYCCRCCCYCSRSLRHCCLQHQRRSVSSTSEPATASPSQPASQPATHSVRDQAANYWIPDPSDGKEKIGLFSPSVQRCSPLILFVRLSRRFARPPVSFLLALSLSLPASGAWNPKARKHQEWIHRLHWANIS